MTNQDVINFLNQVRKILLDDKSWLESAIQPINEAFDKSISALQEQEAKHSTESSLTQKELDTISRQRVHKYHDPFGNPIYVYVRVGDKTVTIKADDLQKALDYVTEHGEEVTIEGRGKAMVEELFDVPDAEGRADGN